MIELKDLIKEPIVFSTSWEYDYQGSAGKVKHFLYITSKGVYLYNYSFLNKRYSYSFYSLSRGNVSLSNGLLCYKVSWNGVLFQFSEDPEGLEQAKKIYLALVTALNSI